MSKITIKKPDFKDLAKQLQTLNTKQQSQNQNFQNINTTKGPEIINVIKPRTIKIKGDGDDNKKVLEKIEKLNEQKKNNSESNESYLLDGFDEKITSEKTNKLITTDNNGTKTEWEVANSFTKDGIQKAIDVGKQSPDECLTFSHKYCSAILENSNATNVNKDSYTLLGSENKQKILEIMRNEVLNGRPCIIRVNGSPKGDGKYSRHFVAVLGIKSSAKNNKILQESDFLILDPAACELKELNKTFSPKDNKDLWKRFLLKGEDNQGKNASSGYVVLPYCDKAQSNKYKEDKEIFKPELG